VSADQDDIPHAASIITAFGAKVSDTDGKLSFALATASVDSHFSSPRPHLTRSIAVEGAGGGNRTP
jgi:hypothetical protein